VFWWLEVLEGDRSVALVTDVVRCDLVMDDLKKRLDCFFSIGRVALADDFLLGCLQVLVK